MTPACATAKTMPNPGPDAAAIEVRELTKTFRGAHRPALDALSITVPQGLIFGIIGPNGAGKTTLLSILCGLLKPNTGTVRMLGQDMLTESARVKRVMGVVPQEPAVYPTLTARENLEYFGRMQGLSGAYLQERIQACLDLAEIGMHADRRVEQFSGGYRRRLNLVIGLIHEPRLLILDEPTVAIDPHSRSLIHQRLRELHAAGVSIVLTTHYMEEAEKLCHHVAIINHGRIVTQGSVPELLATRRGDVIQISLDREPPAELAKSLAKTEGIREFHLGGRCLTAASDQPARSTMALLQSLSQAGLVVESLGYGSTSLERVFLELTGEEAMAADE